MTDNVKKKYADSAYQLNPKRDIKNYFNKQK